MTTKIAITINAVTLFCLIVYYLWGRFGKTLTPNQNMEMIISTVLFIIFFAITASILLNDGNILAYGSIAGFLYLQWYYWTYNIVNYANRDANGIIIYN